MLVWFFLRLEFFPLWHSIGSCTIFSTSYVHLREAVLWPYDLLNIIRRPCSPLIRKPSTCHDVIIIPRLHTFGIFVRGDLISDFFSVSFNFLDIIKRMPFSVCSFAASMKIDDKCFMSNSHRITKITFLQTALGITLSERGLLSKPQQRVFSLLSCLIDSTVFLCDPR